MRRSSLAWLLCGCALVLPRPSLADDTADEADLKFRLGAEAYQRADYRGALEHFLVSNRLVPNRNVIYNIARCYEELKQYPEAYRYFTLALKAETNAEVQARIQRALGSIKQFVAVLEVESEPAGATVFIERRDLGPRGSTPTSLGLRPAAYVVLAELPGYYPARAEVPALAAGQTQRVSLKLEPVLGTVKIPASLAGTSVRVDDAQATPACLAPCELQLAEGRHTLYFERAGYQPSQLQVEVRAKQVQELKAEQVALTGSVVVSTDEPGALIEIDGRPRGFTPQVLTLPVGTHTLSVALAGYKPVTRNVLVENAREQRVEVVLTQAEEVTAASRSTEGVDDAPSSVSIIGERELKSLRYPTIGEALRGLPGVYTWNDRSYLAVGFRGLGRLGS
ncbi:MAG TPA: PEGA domain-containing protein, partial [Polyangiaceae bacterium]|nr:PEGA domain-containing protein [Polyangiaceae bacterium]